MSKKTTKKELLEQLQRLQAEFENYRKRVERDKEQHTLLANEHLIRELLPVLDNFTLALTHAKDKNGINGEELFKGITLIQNQLNMVLEQQGVKEIDTTCAFDPKLHEALTTTEDTKKSSGTITEAFQRGYTLADRVLRPAKVNVIKNKEAS